MVERTEKLQSSMFALTNSELSLATKLWVNQIKTNGSFHFDTSSKIFGLGYRHKYPGGEWPHSYGIRSQNDHNFWELAQRLDFSTS